MNNALNASIAILSGSLRPWTKENQDGEKFRQLLSHGVRAQKDNGTSFFTALISAFKKSRIGIEADIVQEFSDLGKIDLNSDVIEKFIPLELPAFFNKQTEFYSCLIRNEFAGTLLYLDQMVSSMEEVDARYNILKVFKKIDSILNQLKDVTHKDRTTLFILDILKVSIYFIHQEVLRLYAEFIDFDVLSENELVDRITPEIENKNTHSEIGDFISKYKASCQLIRQEKENDKKKTEKHKSEKFLKAEKLILNSFTYIYFYQKKDNLTDLWNNLRNKFIDNKTSIGNFKKVFSGEEISDPVIWTGNPSELYWFIQLIYTKNKLVKDLKQNQWKVACRCFVQPNGDPFDRSKLRNLKRPERTGALLEKAVELLK